MNGLICFKYVFDDKYVVCIWNPSLSAVLTLPPSSVCSQKLYGFHFRFGYDPQTDDYKVIKFTTLYDPYRMVPHGEVYSMKKGSWEFISQRIPSDQTILYDRDLVCADGHDGHLHWICSTDSKEKEKRIMAFDLGAETFTEIPLPDSIQHFFSYLGVLGGKVCVMSSPINGVYEVWVMEEYGVAKSLVKRHVLPHKMYPFGFTSRSQLLFEDGEHTIGLYDPVAAKSKGLGSRI